MIRALELARQGLGTVEPNPAVGAVIVDDDLRLLGEGWHQRFGGPHAEVHALKQAGEAARGATLYVTLEPCCHFGKTPPCSQAVIAAGLKKVVIAMTDPAPHVSGGGLAELQAAGIDVEVGLLGAEARRLTAPFVMLQTRQRPWVHAKWAMTLDGKLATSTGHSQWISNELSRQWVHTLRGRMDAIIVGIGTALADDPSLTARPPGPRTATRVVVDTQARLPLTSRLVQTATLVPVIVVCGADAAPERRAALQAAGVEVLALSVSEAGYPDPQLWLTEFGRRRMSNVLVEGGSGLFGGLWDARLIDEVHAFIAPKLVGGLAAPSPIGGTGLPQIPQTANLENQSVQLLKDNILLNGFVRYD